MKIITTSWDDGHPMDLKLAELLDKYNLPATFYIPKSNLEHVVMEESVIVGLSKKFEIGGHTLNHTRLYNNLSRVVLKNEIEGCYHWIEDLQGFAPTSFCFPGGVFNKQVIDFAYASGFKILRTTELLSTKTTSNHGLMPTTLQVFDHPKIAYLKNTVKRSKYKNLTRWLATTCATDVVKLTDFYLKQVAENGGCFHLWGHSWEIEANNLWPKLALVFKQIANVNEFKYLQNKDFSTLHF